MNKMRIVSTALFFLMLVLNFSGPPHTKVATTIHVLGNFYTVQATTLTTTQEPVTEAWVVRYNGPGNTWDQPTAMAVDSAGNVYVTGISTGSSTGWDYATIKYDSNGNQLWVARYNGPANSTDMACALAVDGAGNVYVTGASFREGGIYMDYATVKYATNGDQLWVSRYGGLVNQGGSAHALAVDSQGNVYVTGESWGGTSQSDYATVKYDPNGNQLWVARYNGPGNADDYAFALALDAAGNVYVTGYSHGGNTGYDYATVKYDSNGNQLWVARYNGPGSGSDIARAIAVDDGGSVYVTGFSRTGTSWPDYADFATVKYDPNGNQLWVARYDGPGAYDDLAHALALDREGNVYVAGDSASTTSRALVTIKYAPNGNQLWVSRYDGGYVGSTGTSVAVAKPLAADQDGNIYVAGRFLPSGVDPKILVIKHDANGSQVWVGQYNGGPSEDWATSLALDEVGDVYVAGCSESSETGLDYITIKYVQGPPSDTTPPAVVTDLTVTSVTTDSITLTWTAVGDDENIGTATTYDIRYSTSPITEANWDSATQVAGEPQPKPAGGTETFTVTGLSPGTTYYFALKTADEVPNWSGLSNVLSATTAVVNQPLVASFTCSPESPFYSGDVVTFDASASIDFDGTIVSYQWDFGDGTTGEGKIVTHRFRGAMDEPKTYHVSLTVEDDQGTADAISVEVVVKPLSKTVEVTRVPSSLPVTEAYARMTISYNWVETTDGEDVYMVSRIRVSSGGFTGYYSFFILDAHSGMKPLVMWWDILPAGVGEVYASPFPSHVPSALSRLFPNWEPQSPELRFYGEDFFEGFIVHGCDVMNIRATGWPPGIHIGTDPMVVMLKMLATTFFEEDSAYFDPERVEEPHIPIDINDFNMAHLCSPGELRVYDLQGRVTGLVNGEVRRDIPDSYYFDNSVLVLSPEDSLRYEVVGEAEAAYGLTLISAVDEEFNIFIATDIPTSTDVVHQYTVDWAVLSSGEEGVTISVDSEGDGIFERTFTSDGELVRDEFILQTTTAIDFDPDTLNLKSKGNWVTVYIELPVGYDLSQINISSIKLNGTVPALTKPVKIGDYDGDGTPDLMVKFDRASVIALFTGKAVPGNYVVKITGYVGGIRFEGIATIRIISS